MKKILLSIIVFYSICSYAHDYNEPDSYYNKGQLIQFYDIDGLKISLTVKQINCYGDYYSINVAILNKNNNRFDFMPTDIRVNYILNKKNKIKEARVFSFQEYEKKVKNKQAWSEMLSGLSAGLQAASVSMTPSATIYNSNGNIANIYSQAQKNEEIRDIYSQANNSAISHVEDIQTINEGYLKRHTLFTNNNLIGYVNVKYKECDRLDIKIPVNGNTFKFSWIFEFPVEDKKADDIYR